MSIQNVKTFLGKIIDRDNLSYHSTPSYNMNISSSSYIYLDKTTDSLIIKGRFGNLAVKLAKVIYAIVNIFSENRFQNTRKKLSNYLIHNESPVNYINNYLTKSKIDLKPKEAVSVSYLEKFIEKKGGLGCIEFNRVGNTLCDYRDQLITLLQDTSKTATDITAFFSTEDREDKLKLFNTIFSGSKSMMYYILEALPETTNDNTIEKLDKIIEFREKSETDQSRSWNRSQPEDLALACKKNTVGIVKLLFKEKTTQLVHNKFDTDENALRTACKNRNKEIINFFLENKNDDRVKIAIGNLFNKGSKDEIECFIDICNSIDITISPYKHKIGVYLSTYACMVESTTALEVLLDKFPEETKKALLKEDSDKNLPFHYACRYSNLEMIEFLLGLESQLQDPQQEINFLNTSSNSGATPLMYACLGERVEIIEFLINQKNVDVSSVDKDGNTAFMRECRYYYSNMTPVILSLLLDASNSLNDTNNNGETALIIACKAGRNNTIQFLLSNDADILVQDHTEKTAIDYLLENELDGYVGCGDDRKYMLIRYCFEKIQVTSAKKEAFLQIARDKGYTKTAKLLQEIKPIDG